MHSTTSPSVQWHDKALEGIAHNFNSMVRNLQQLKAAVLHDAPGPQQQRRPSAQPAWSSLSVSSDSASSSGVSSSGAYPAGMPNKGGRVSKEELGRATWVLLHTMAAQYPVRPSRQQQQDAKNLVRQQTGLHMSA